MEKSRCMVQTLRRLSSIDLSSNTTVSPKKPITSDDLIPLTLLTLIKSQVMNLSSNLSYVKSFTFEQDVNQGESGFTLLTFEAAIAFAMEQEDSLIMYSKRIEELFKLASSSLASTDELEAFLNNWKDKERSWSLVRNPFDETIFLFACRQGLEKVVDVVIETSDLEARDSRFQTGIHLALEHKRFDFALHLISILSPSLLSLQNSHQETPLHLATKQGAILVIQALIRKCPMDAFCRDKFGNTPIFYAQNREALEFLLSSGAQINEKNDMSLTPLLYQIQVSKNQMNPDLIDAFLAQSNLDLNAEDQGRRTLLHFCAFNGLVSLCKRIINENKISINSVSRRGNTCLHAAAEAGHLELVRLFLGEGADPTIRNIQGRTPADVSQKDEIKGLLHGTLYFQRIEMKN